jgi:phage repressor protein C with HTH and peptisase S24 domain
VEEATWQDILKRLLVATKSGSEAALANHLGLSSQSIYNAKNKGQIPPAWIIEVSKTFGVSADWLIFGDGPMTRLLDDSTSDSRKPLLPCPAPEHDSIDIVWISRLKARLSAGGGSFEVETECNGRFAFRSDWIRRKGNPDTMVLMEVSGESMSPDICDGDMALIDQSQNELVAGGVFAVGVEETIMIKELDVEPGFLLIRSKNKEYETIRIPRGGDIEQGIRIIGRVIWWCREAR